MAQFEFKWISYLQGFTLFFTFKIKMLHLVRVCKTAFETMKYRNGWVVQVGWPSPEGLQSFGVWSHYSAKFIKKSIVTLAM